MSDDSAVRNSLWSNDEEAMIMAEVRDGMVTLEINT
jgi:hypothetical protein